jgi:hypothetical protein
MGPGQHPSYLFADQVRGSELEYFTEKVAFLISSLPSLPPPFSKAADCRKKKDMAASERITKELLPSRIWDRLRVRNPWLFPLFWFLIPASLFLRRCRAADVSFHE